MTSVDGSDPQDVQRSPNYWRNKDFAWLAAIVLLTAFAAYLRFKAIDERSLWWDEFATLQQVRPDFWGMIVATARDTYPPGYNVFCWVSVHLFGDTELGLRLPAALFGIACIPTIYWLGKSIANRTVGFVAAALLTISPFAIAYSQEARAYSLFMLMAAAYIAAVLSLASKPSRTRFWLAVTFGAVLLYSHPYATFLFASVAASLLFSLRWTGADRTARSQIWRASLASACIFLPWAVVLAAVASRLTADGFWITRPTVDSVLAALSSLTGSAVLSLPMLALVIVAAPLAVLRLRSNGQINQIPVVAVLLAAACGPLVLGVGISLIGTPVFTTRYLAGGLPAVLVGVAWAANAISSTKAIRAAICAGIFVLAGYNWTVQKFTISHQDWRGAADYVANMAGSFGCVIVKGGIEKVALDFYLRGRTQCELPFKDADLKGAISGTAPSMFFVGISKRSAEEVKKLQQLMPAPNWSNQKARFGAVSVVSYIRQP